LAWLFLEDHFPGANAPLRLLRHPLATLGSCVAAALLCGLLVAPQGFVVAGIGAAVLLIGLFWPGFTLRGVDCRWEFAAERFRVGQATGVVLHVVNRWPWPVWGLTIECGVHGRGSAAPPEAALARVGPWTRSEFRWEFVPRRRGRYPVETLRLCTEFPFGLWRASRPVVCDGSCTVWPAALPAPALAFSAGSDGRHGEAGGRRGGSVGEKIGVREYRPGDAVRSIHWAKTAARDRLIVSERQAPMLREAYLELDPADAAADATGTLYDQVVGVAAAVAERLVAEGVAVRLRLAERSVLAAPGRRGAAAALDWLAIHDETSREAHCEQPALAADVRSERAAGRVGPLVYRVTTRSRRAAAHEVVVLVLGQSPQTIARLSDDGARLVAGDRMPLSRNAADEASPSVGRSRHGS
jgi:uncharacterized protein (DUF58 family)